MVVVRAQKCAGEDAIRDEEAIVVEELDITAVA
jgi:hypothetical protein